MFTGKSAGATKSKLQKPTRSKISATQNRGGFFISTAFYFHPFARNRPMSRRRKNVSKEEILASIKKMAEELGRAQGLRTGKRRSRIHNADGRALSRLGGAYAETGKGAEDWRVRDVRKVQR